MPEHRFEKAIVVKKYFLCGEGVTVDESHHLDALENRIFL